METLITLLLLPLALYLAIAGIYQLALALASQTVAKESVSFTGKQNKFLILVPAYKEDTVVLESTRKNLSLKYQYPAELFDYVVISDGLKRETNEALKRLGAQVEQVKFDKSTKVKSLQQAIRNEEQTYDAVVVLDADNVVPVNFLYKANQYINAGYQAVQGQRIAANEESVMACLDGFSEAANNAMLCQGANRLGFSSKLSGSGMVFSFDLFQSVIAKLEAIGGFDKEMELILTKQRVFIKYAADLIVEDQKVGSFESYQKQRGRWLESQYNFLKKAWSPAIQSLKTGNIDHFHKALQLALPPRALAPFALLLLTIASYWLSPALFIISIAGLGTNIGSYLLTIPSGPLFRQSWRIALAMPALFWSTLKALTWMKRSRTEFLHTSHQLINS